jgi:hypothetical protein
MKTTLLFAKVSLTVIAFYAYISFAFVYALQTLTYPKSEAIMLVNEQPLKNEYIAAQVTLKQAAATKKTDLSY